jgi:phenylacetate-coenzyme A ligase PaaK-like adenylate-forming protein
MPCLAELFTMAPYSLASEQKSAFLAEGLCDLTRRHYEACQLYRNILDAIGFDLSRVSTVADIPFLPVRLFKELDLLSVSREEVIKTMTSSGTTGQAVSRIYLDRETSANQMKVLTKIVSSFVGLKRLPMLILDTPSVLKDRFMFSARGAGILGFSIFASDKAYALDDAMNLDLPAIESFLAKYQGRSVLLFGFTFMVWQHFYKELLENKRAIDLSEGILIHGGGWKKLVHESVTPEEFKKRLNDVCGLRQIHDYYGMVEQTGSIYMECEAGHLHASNYSDVIIRRFVDFSPAEVGEPGIIEVVSLLPESYPGHALLTEDEGVKLGEDGCPCGRLGTYFKVLGRLKNAEIRGCSDTYAAQFS